MNNDAKPGKNKLMLSRVDTGGTGIHAIPPPKRREKGGKTGIARERG